MHSSRLVATLAASLTLAGVLCVAGGAFAEGFESDGSTIQIVSTLLGGKNVFIPSTVVVVAGQETQLSIFNTTEVPHGFHIPAADIEVVIEPGKETPVTLPPLEGGKVHQINCHLHPAHRTATLVVLPAKAPSADQ
jgi:heme/copper-type cytochrome/quinol oxidase subunit 2